MKQNETSSPAQHFATFRTPSRANLHHPGDLQPPAREHRASRRARLAHSTEEPCKMASREGTAGGTGFLFGNIDKRGRLDEDYMDDDAKDTIDNVGSKVVEKDRDLREITEALPQHKRGFSAPAPDSDDEDYDDDLDAPAEKAPDGTPRVDYYDEDDLLADELDENQRSHMASLALRKATHPHKTMVDDDDDENYDDDDADPPAPSVAPLATPPRPSSIKPITAFYPVPAPRVKPPSPPSPVDPALAEQRRLMEQARLAAVAAPPSDAVILDPNEEIEENPLHFSQVFTRPTPTLRFTPRRCRFGLVFSSAQIEPPIEIDDTEILDREHPPDEVDAVGIVLAFDAENAAKRRPAGQTEVTSRLPFRKEEASEVDEEEYANAAAPLETVDENGGDTTAERGLSGIQTDFPLVQQVSWEDEIRWRDSDESEDEDDAWYSPEASVGVVKGDEPRDPSAKEVGGDDDDDDEFEEPVLMNVEKPGPGKDKDSDSDDDMEWEDGQESANKADEANKVFSALIEEPAGPPAKKNGLTSEVPPVHALPNNSSNRGPNVTEGPEDQSPMKTAAGKIGASTTQIAKPLIPKSAAVSKFHPGQDVEPSVLAPNKELEQGLWLEDVVWDSHSEEEGDVRSQPFQKQNLAFGMVATVRHVRRRFSQLILDMNDPNMIFEHLSDDSIEKSTLPPRVAEVNDGQVTKAKMNALIHSSGTQVHQLLESDRFNISNDIYYASGASNFLKVDRRSILRGLQNAPPAVKCLTTKTVSTDAELLWFRRPVLTLDRLPKAMLINPFRRKRPKGGHAQIAGQIPKKKTELFCSEKDAYRVSLYEYALERQPCILPVPGMASRIVTYARKESAAAAAQALKNAAGTPEADTVFMSPDEPPPLHAGDLEANGRPLSVVESHVYAAPCVRQTAKTTDFLLVRNGDKMYVREIDSVVSLGVTEPKVEVMAPNSERYKRYGRERALLWALREFLKKRKEIARQQKLEKRGNRDDDDFSSPAEKPFIEKEAILRTFRGCRTRPEAWLFKVIKEFSRYQNGKFTIEEEPAKSLAVREAEVLRTVTPQETAAFESMEAGWEGLSDTGIQIFTHPSSQGNIIAAAERSGLEAGPAVAAFIKSRLLKSPWFKSQNIISAQRQQRKELLQVLSLARIANDLKDGGAVMESRLMSLTAAEMNNVLTNQYKLNSKKIPTDVGERRALVREMAQRKAKGPSHDVSDYAALIRHVLIKHRAAGLGKSAANVPQGMSTTTGIFLGLPLEQQRRALEDGDVSQLQTEDEDFAADVDAAAAFAATGEDAFGKRPIPKDKDGRGGLNKRNAKKPPKPPKKAVSARPVTPQAAADAEEQAELHKLLNSSAITAKPANGPKSQNDEPRKVPKKKVTRLKITRKVMGPDGPTYTEDVVTDPVEIERLLKKRNMKKKPGDRSATSSGKAKVAIDLKMLQQGSKAGAKKKLSVGPEKKKSSKKASVKPSGSSDPDNARKGNEKGTIRKIKINTKQLRIDKEEAALKRKRSQYGDDVEYRAKKTTKTSRRKRNGTVQLNNILEKVEKTIRETEGYVVTHTPYLKVARLKEGESPPPGAIANNLAAPKNTGLDFTAPVDAKMVPTYKQIIKKPMYLNLIKHKCKQGSYQSASDFIADMELLVKNASDFNKTPDVAWVVQHAELLLEVAREQISRRADEIRSAEDMVKIEKAEAKAGGAGSSSSKGKGKRAHDKTQQQNGKKSGNKKRKGLSGEVVVIDDAETDGNAAKEKVPVIDLSEEPPRSERVGS